MTFHDYDEEKALAESESERMSAEAQERLVAFGGWRCGCTCLAERLEDIPRKCPTHDESLLDRPSLETNPHNVPLEENSNGLD